VTESSVIIYIDGGSRGNPGPAASGVVILADDGKTELFAGGFFLGRATNNVAEYTGLIHALRQAQAIGAEHVSVFSDSELMVCQINGQYRVKNAGLKALYEQATALSKEFASFRISHVYREQNAHADKLVNMALNRKTNVGDAAAAEGP
jgi:ribonuclease HI